MERGNVGSKSNGVENQLQYYKVKKMADIFTDLFELLCDQLLVEGYIIFLLLTTLGMT